jgi:hypothetical protein
MLEIAALISSKHDLRELSASIPDVLSISDRLLKRGEYPIEGTDWYVAFEGKPSAYSAGRAP